MAVDKRSSRLAILGTIAAVLFGSLVLRLWFLQAVDAPVLQERVQANKTRTVKLLPERGRIFDRDGRILADNERILTMTMSWDVMRRTADRLELFRRLAPVLQTTPSELETRYKSDRYSPLLPMPLKEGVSEETAIYLIQRTEDFPGIDVTVQWRRQYPFAPLAAHAIGYLGAITKNDSVQYRELGYDLNERVGQFGVEKSFETYLRGVPGYVTYEVDSRGAILGVLERKEPVPGYDLQLAIDLDYQQFAEQALETQLRVRRNREACQAKDKEGNLAQPFETIYETVDGTRVARQGDPLPACANFSAPAGSVVMMDYSNGHVMAIASYPTFDNRWFNASISGDKFSQIFPRTDDPDKSILVNRAIQGQYNLGSSFKPFVAYAALISGQLPKEDPEVGGPYIFHDRHRAGTDRGGNPIWVNGVYRLRYNENCNALYDEQQGGTASGTVQGGAVKCFYRNALCAGTSKPCYYGDVNVEDALAVSVDTFFYKIGEEIYAERGVPDPQDPSKIKQPFILQQEVRRFGFGSRTGIDLPFEASGRVPDEESKSLLVRTVDAFKGEGNYRSTDNVLLAIGQGLLAASPLQLTQAYGAIGSGGEVNRPLIAIALLEPGTPNATDVGFADLTRARVFLDLGAKNTVRKINFPSEISEPIRRGLARVITGPGVTSDYYHSTTGEKLFSRFPYDLLPIAGKTGTAQGRLNLPWNDSSVFAAFSLDPNQPIVASAYLEKAGYGSQGAAPVVKCVLLAFAGQVSMSPVLPANPLDINATDPAPQRSLRDRACLAGDMTGGRD